MPYTEVTELPENLREILPVGAQRVFIEAFDSAWDKWWEEDRCFAYAWGAVKRAGYRKGDDGKWHLVRRLKK